MANKKSYIIIFNVLLVLCSFPSSAESIDNSQYILAEGVSFYNQNNYTAALESFNDLTLLHPQLPSGWLWKGSTLLSLGRITESDNAFRTGRCLLNPEQCNGDIRFKPDEIQEKVLNKDLITSSAEKKTHHQNKNDSNKSSISLDEGNLFLFRDLQDPHTGKSLTSMIEEGQVIDVINALDSLIERNPNNPELVMFKGDITQNLSLEESLDLYQEAERMNFYDPSLYEKKGDVQSLLGMDEESLQSYDNSISLIENPTNKIPIHLKKIDRYCSQGKFSHAIDEVDKISSLSSSSLSLADLAYLKGNIFNRSGNLSQAKEFFDQAMRLDPGNIKFQRSMNQIPSNVGKSLNEPNSLDETFPIPELSSQIGAVPDSEANSYYYEKDTAVFPLLSSAGYLWILLPVGIVIGYFFVFRRNKK